MLRRLLDPVGDVQRWADVANGLVSLPAALAGFVAVVVWWSVALTATTHGLWAWAVP